MTNKTYCTVFDGVSERYVERIEVARMIRYGRIKGYEFRRIPGTTNIAVIDRFGRVTFILNTKNRYH